MKLGIEEYLFAFRAYKDKRNVTDALKERLKIDYNTPEIISLAYDLQAGTYSEKAATNTKFYAERADEIVQFAGAKLGTFNSILDVGTGELTMYSRLLQRLILGRGGVKAFATDISWSRLDVGLNSTRDLLPKNLDFKCAVADTEFLPFATKSIDIVISDHSLEPNGARINDVMREIFRCARNLCVFTEPSNDLQTEEGLKRMKRLGYIFNLEKTIEQLGGKVIATKNLVHNYNELNKAKILLVEPPLIPNKKTILIHSVTDFCYPSSDYLLQKKDAFMYFQGAGILFPIVKGIPILLKEKAILASKFNDGFI